LSLLVVVNLVRGGSDVDSRVGHGVGVVGDPLRSAVGVLVEDDVTVILYVLHNMSSVRYRAHQMEGTYSARLLVLPERDKHVLVRVRVVLSKHGLESSSGLPRVVCRDV
jgi:hypothetical protein